MAVIRHRYRTIRNLYNLVLSCEILAAVSCWLEDSNNSTVNLEQSKALYPLSIGGFFLLSDDLPADNLCLEAAKMAIRDVNANSQILPEYNLSLTWANTECSEPIVTSELMKMIAFQQSEKGGSDCLRQNPAIAVMGPLCGVECEVTGPIVKMWDSIQVSYGCGAAAKDKRLKKISNPYSNFFRLEPSLSQYNKARLSFLNKFGWQRVFMLYHSGRSGIGFLEDEQELVKFLIANKISVPLGELWLYSAVDNLERMLREDARIIFLGFSQVYLQYALKAGCEAFGLGMKGPKYVWISIAYLSPFWWRYGMFNESDGCTVEQLDEVFDGMFYVGESNDANLNRMTPVGRSLNDVHREMMQNLANMTNICKELMIYVPPCYDNVVILALALNQTEEELTARQSPVRLHNFYENRRLVSDLMVQKLHQLDYFGFKGHYKFDNSTNDPIYDNITIYRDLKAVRKAVFWFDQVNGTAIFNPRDIVWRTRNGQAPSDGATIITVSIEVKLGLQIAIDSLCAICISSALIYAAALIYKLKSIEVRRMSPKLVLIMLIGCISIYLHLSLITNDPRLLPWFCQIRLFLLLLGCCLLFGGLFIKVFRVFIIFTRIKQHFLLNDWKLIVAVIAWTLINLSTLFIWFAVGSFKAGVVTRYVTDSEDVIIKQITLKCVQNYTTEFLYIFCSLQGAILLFGIFVSFFTRNVTVTYLPNDSKQIALCVYITALSTVLAFVLAYAVEDVNASYGLMSAVVLSATFCIQWVIVYSLNNDIVTLIKCSKNPVTVSPTIQFVDSSGNIVQHYSIPNPTQTTKVDANSGRLDIEIKTTPTVVSNPRTRHEFNTRHRQRFIRQSSCPYMEH